MPPNDLLRRWWTPEELAARHARAEEVAHSLLRRPPDTPDRDAWLARADIALTDAARRAAEAPHALAAADEVRRICNEAYGSATWGDKYNEYLLDLPWLLHVFPRARWVFVCRDPHEVIGSMLAWQGKPWNPSTVEACALKWADWTQCWLDARQHIEPVRRVELTYDDICAGRVDQAVALLGVSLRARLRGYGRQPESRPVSEIPRPAQELWDKLLTITTAEVRPTRGDCRTGR